MQVSTPQVDWSSYAQKYDMLLTYNPFYQQLFLEVVEIAHTWEIPKGGGIVDIGAGTGNYSLEWAQFFP
ncbi:MAG: hypothetical protein AAF694_27940 [Bacteroidota bacterium]